MKEFDPDISLAENWRTADPLDFAWFAYAPGELKEQLQNAGSHPGRNATLRRLMEAEVCGQIGHGELIAFGILIVPELEDTPRQIPSALFQAHSTSIDWADATVAGLGRTFAEVRVCVPQTPQPEPDAEIDRADSGYKPRKRGGGRNSQYPQAREILAFLFKEPSYAVLSARELLEPFNRAYLEKFRPPGGRLSPISERSLRDHLKRYRQELAETGRN